MQATTWSAIAALIVGLGVAAPADAQGRSKSRDSDRYERAERERDRDDDDDRRVADRADDGVFGRVSGRSGDARSQRNERGNGPSFCRSGSGHPVFGWDWCRERGWDRSGSSAVRWENRSWEDVIFRIPRGDRRETLDRRGLGDVLGDIVFGRIDTRRRQLSRSTDYVGRWLTAGSSRELWISAGGVPVARLVDRNGDRRVDAVFMAER
ncbi:MAG TPA: hypothetical protein VMN78_11820 [Longimicrobiales bacterium]|nr:hypothetical protein [Longimicrobiales bacterium]